VARQTYSNPGGTTQLSLQARRIYQTMLIQATQPFLALWDDAKKSTLPLHTGGFGSNEVQWRRWRNLAVDTTASTENGAVTMLDLAQDEITTNLQIYKAGIELSDVVVNAGIDNVFAAAVEKLGQRAGRQTHLVMIAALEGGIGASSTWAGGSNVTFGGSATSTGTLAAGDKFSVPLLNKVRREFERRNVDPFPDGTYHVAAHPDQIHDLRLDPRWERLVMEGAGRSTTGGDYAPGRSARSWASSSRRPPT
jgi:N4-gp56 family major capsid protein